MGNERTAGRVLPGINYTDVQQDNENTLSEFVLMQNSPNPFNQTTNISYNIRKDGPVSLTVYDLLGRKVKTLINENQSAGIKNAVWDGRDSHGVTVGSGNYFYRLKAESFIQSRAMTLVK